MKAEELLRAGDLEGALAELQARIRKDAGSAPPRVFLFQLLCVLGRWDRAATQLEVLAEMDPSTTPMVQTYRSALVCERLRAEVFAGKRSPLVFGKPEEWVALLVEALKLTAQGKHEEARGLRARAFEAAPATAGSSGAEAGKDGERFAWIADGDSRLGPMLEAIVNGRYTWIPFARLQAVRVEKPADLRDVVWTPAYLTLANGGELVALLPTRYPGSEESSDGAIRLARKTEWREIDADTVVGLGQRILATDLGDLALMDVRSLQLEGIAEPAVGEGDVPAGDHG